ncbi:MAG: flagellar assembly protein FliX, partial [Alphaproteobacteria bacterium]
MKIEGTSSVPTSPLRTRRVGATKGVGNFSAHMEAEEAAATAAPVAVLTPTPALVALQEVDDAIHGRRAVIRVGHDILDELERLKIELLEGRVSGARLAVIARLVRRRREECD